MKKVAIVGVEGSGKTVMLAGLGDLYIRPDQEGYFLAPKNFGTAEYVAEKMERMRKGEWPTATAGDEMQGLDWTLKRREPGTRQPSETVCEVSFLDFAGEVYRTAFGIGEGDASLAEQVEELKKYVREADDLIVLVNLRDIIAGVRDARVKEAKWITKAILDVALAEEERKAPRAAIVLSQADSYAETIKSCGGALGVLEQYLPYVAAEYGWLDVFAANAVDKTMLDDDGNVVPAAGFTTQGLLPILKWIRGEKVSGGGLGEAALPGSDLTGGSRSCATVTGAETAADRGHKKVQLWKNGPYWAETNIGAENPWDFGYYFWWGDTVGYKYEVLGWFNRLFSTQKEVWVASDGSSLGFSFSEGNIPTYGKDNHTLRREGWITAGGVLVPKHDAAHVKWGGGWRLPTKLELDELNNKCDWTWTTVKGVNGYVVRGKGDYASASIFLPATGNGNATLLNYAGSAGNYRSSVSYSLNVWGLGFSSRTHILGHGSRNFGQSVRPVQGFTK